MRRTKKNDFNLIILINIIFLIAIISALTYLNPHGYFSLNENEVVVKSWHLKLLVVLVLLLGGSNLLLIKDHIKERVLKGRL